MNNEVKLETYKNPYGALNYCYRFLWIIVWMVGPWLIPLRYGLGLKWRTWLIRLFGARIGNGCGIQPMAKIREPRNLIVGDKSCLANGVNCSNGAMVKIGRESIITSGTYLCTSTHDFRRSNFPLVRKPIIIGDSVWIAADAFIGPGVTIGDGAVVGARAVVVKDVEPWTVVAGNPARVVGRREIKESSCGKG